VEKTSAITAVLGGKGRIFRERGEKAVETISIGGAKRDYKYEGTCGIFSIQGEKKERVVYKRNGLASIMGNEKKEGGKDFFPTSGELKKKGKGMEGHQYIQSGKKRKKKSNAIE